ncbi:MAG TPA: glycoside hydrolase family 13 protein [Candidatus Mediterraneibacter colneyensis]|nr:glycoside hydrolase family 13 protein [Candidatus Mediterraneibacter colneyensis]
MDFAAVYHKTSEQMSYPLDEERLIINLKTGYDVEQVYIIHGDPFDAGILGGSETWKGRREEIVYKKRLPHQIWWTTTLTPPYRRCRYYFELHSSGEVWYYFEDGFLTEEQLNMPGRILQYFTVPWMNPADVNRTPGWVNDTVWYQIFPDRFCNGDPERDSADTLPWQTGPVGIADKYGGDLEGICRKIPYLAELGVTGIYLNPVMEAGSNHKYDTTDYMRIDPAFGDDKVMQRLVALAHEKGIRVMMDAVFNHCGSRFAPWLDVLEKGKKSKYADWFMIRDWEQIGKRADTRDGRFYSFSFSDRMPKLNTNHEEVTDYFCTVCEKWVRRYDIDGIRFDVGNEVSHRFLKQIRKHLKNIKPDIYLLGEIWHDASQWLMGDEYDSVMNYPLMSGIHDYFIDRTMDKKEFEYMVNRCYTMYMQQNNNVLFNLLDSHDTERLMNRFHDLDIFYQQLAVLFTLPGSPCIYYGTEIAMEGSFDPDCRRCMPWDEIGSEENRKRISQMKALIRLRKTEEACRSLHFHFPNRYPNRRCVEYIKLDSFGRKLEVVLNCSGENVAAGDEGEVLFERNFSGGILGKNGTLIRRVF